MTTRNTNSDRDLKEKRSEAAHKMSTGATRQERSKGAKELSNSRTPEEKRAAGQKGGQAHGKGSASNNNR